MEISLEAAFSVSSFLDVLNESFAGMWVSVRGEVSGIEERRNVVYFSLKDSSEDGILSCLIFRNDLLLQGIRIEEGLEVVVEGMPNIWKPRGKFSFRVRMIRLAGEGALKKAYDALREKLSLEGLFSLDRKRLIPDFPRRIALVTSREGAAIGDFSANLSRCGLSVSLFDAHVEGKRALDDLIEGISFFNKNPNQWDALALIRGGGSFESLAAYNEERLVRAIAESKIPTIAGIGHEKDVPLAALAADVAVSTPTAVAKILGSSWENASERFFNLSHSIVNQFQQQLLVAEGDFRSYADFSRDIATRASLRFRKAERDADRAVITFLSWEANARRAQVELWRNLCREFASMLDSVKRQSDDFYKRIEMQSPQSVLARGYGILQKNGSVLRGVSDVEAGDDVEIILMDGTIHSVVSSKFLKTRDAE